MAMMFQPTGPVMVSMMMPDGTKINYGVHHVTITEKVRYDSRRTQEVTFVADVLEGEYHASFQTKAAEFVGYEERLENGDCEDDFSPMKSVPVRSSARRIVPVGNL